MFQERERKENLIKIFRLQNFIVYDNMTIMVNCAYEHKQKLSNKKNSACVSNGENTLKTSAHILQEI